MPQKDKRRYNIQIRPILCNKLRWGSYLWLEVSPWGEFNHKSLAGNVPENWGNECTGPKGRDLGGGPQFPLQSIFWTTSIHLLGLKCLAGKLRPITASVLGWQLEFTISLYYPLSIPLPQAPLLTLWGYPDFHPWGVWALGQKVFLSLRHLHLSTHCQNWTEKYQESPQWITLVPNVFFLPSLCNRSPISLRRSGEMMNRVTRTSISWFPYPYTTYWDHTHSCHWFRMYTPPWWDCDQSLQGSISKRYPSCLFKRLCHWSVGWQLPGGAVFDEVREFHAFITSAVTLFLQLWSLI